MITPAYSFTATERVLPRLALDFTTAVTDSRVATARAGNTATRFNPSGLIETVNANLARYDFNPSTLICSGQLIEEARTNLFLNSLIDGINLATQIVVLTNVAHTLSFYGSGTVTISGGHSATVVGTGNFPSRRTLTFTPTVGASTFTVSGDVKFAQLEVGSFATSYIPTAATSVLRNADVVSMTGTNFSDWFNASEGAVFVQIFRGDATGASRGAWRIDSGATNNGMDYRPYGSNNTVNITGVSQVDIYPGGGVANSVVRNVFGYKVNNFAAATNGGAAVTDTLGNLPTVNQMVIGGLSSSTGQILCGHVQKMSYWPQRLTEAEIRAFSK
jgi:hypothetical protein